VPALVGAVEWLLFHGWKKRDVNIVGSLLLKIIKKSDSSNTQRNVVTSIVGGPISRFLRERLATTSRTRGTSAVHVAALEAEVIKAEQQAESQLTLFHPYPELQAIRNTPTSVKSVLRSTLQFLVDWGSTLAINPMQRAPNYTPRTLHVAIGIIGARGVISTILEELKSHMALPDTSAPIALDIFTTLICAPIPGTSHSPTDWIHASTSARNGRLSLREALKLEFEDATKLIQSDQLMAESVVRLHRRVEAQMSMILTNMSEIPDPLMPAMADDTTAGAVDLAAVADSMDFTTDTVIQDAALGMGMDVDPTGAGADLNLGSLDGDDDLFAELMNGMSGDLGDSISFDDI
jgi:mediator of RNA polymerase II transcription subunit 5